jgi:MFS family permease
VINQKEVSHSSSSYKWIVLLLATGTQASATLVTYGIGPLAFFWKQMYHLTQMETGILLSAVNIGPLFFMLFIGRLLDRYNERLLIGLGSILLGLSILAVNTVGGFIGLLFILSMVGIFYSTAQPGGSKVIMKWFPKKLRGLAMGIRQAGIPIGGAMAGAIIPVVSIKYGWPSAIYVLSSLCIIGGLLFFIFYKEPSLHEAPSLAEQQVKSFRKQLQEIMKNKALYPVFFTGICMVSLQMVIVGHLTIFLTNSESLSPTLAGQIFSVSLFLGMLGRIILALISDYFYKGNRRKPLLFSVLAAFASVLIFTMNIHTLPLWSLFLLSGWLGFFGIGWYSLFIVEVAEKSSEDSVGVTVSFALTLNQFAIISAPPIFGFIVDLKGYTWAWLSIDFLLLLSGIGLLKNKSNYSGYR